MPEKNILITGTTGLIGRTLLKNFLFQEQVNLILLVREDSYNRIRKVLDSLGRENLIRSKVTIVIGNIAKENLGLSKDDIVNLSKKINEVYHLAAEVNLRAKKEVASIVNVIGTKNVVDFVIRCSEKGNFRCFHYGSTTGVVGTSAGIFYEEELDKGQRFRNHYELTKFEAEKLVRKNLQSIPTIIYRPSMVIGDSETGECCNFHGPYFIWRSMSKGLLSFLGSSSKAKANIVPVDYVVKAMLHIGAQSRNIGKTFHICEENPLTVFEFLELSRIVIGTTKPKIYLPPKYVKLITQIPFSERIFQIPRQVAEFNEFYCEFDISNTKQALEHTNILCPPLKTYLPKIIEYCRRIGYFSTSGLDRPRFD